MQRKLSLRPDVNLGESKVPSHKLQEGLFYDGSPTANFDQVRGDDGGYTYVGRKMARAMGQARGVKGMERPADDAGNKGVQDEPDARTAELGQRLRRGHAMDPNKPVGVGTKGQLMFDAQKGREGMTGRFRDQEVMIPFRDKFVQQYADRMNLRDGEFGPDNALANPNVYDPEQNTRMMNHLLGKSMGTGAQTMMARVADGLGGGSMNSAGETERGAVQAIQNMRGPAQGAALQRIAGAGADPEFGRETNAFFGKKALKNIVADRDEARKVDQPIVDGMNKDLKRSGMLLDPKFDMSDANKGKKLGEGIFGAVHESKDGKSVIKEGDIGAEELGVLGRLNGNDYFPELLNAEYHTRFGNESQELLNPQFDKNLDDLYNQNIEDGKGGVYYDPDDMDTGDFDGRFANAAARGKYAMGKASGKTPIDLIMDKDFNDPEVVEDFQRKFWDAKGQMHKMGIAHNDMHLNNSLYDPETGKFNMIDFGLAQNNPMAALQEAFGGMSGGDYQSGSATIGDSNMPHPTSYQGGSLPADMMQALEGNMGKIKEKMMSRYKERIDSPYDNLEEGHIDAFMAGGIRNKGTYLEGMGQFFDLHEDDGKGGSRLSTEGHDFVMEMINDLYDGVSDPNSPHNFADANKAPAKQRGVQAMPPAHPDVPANQYNAQKSRPGEGDFGMRGGGPDTPVAYMDINRSDAQVASERGQSAQGGLDYQNPSFYNQQSAQSRGQSAQSRGQSAYTPDDWGRTIGTKFGGTVDNAPEAGYLRRADMSAARSAGRNIQRGVGQGLEKMGNMAGGGGGAAQAKFGKGLAQKADAAKEQNRVKKEKSFRNKGR